MLVVGGALTKRPNMERYGRSCKGHITRKPLNCIGVGLILGLQVPQSSCKQL